jgi:beta-N-acetylhexosaminidase
MIAQTGGADPGLGVAGVTDPLCLLMLAFDGPRLSEAARERLATAPAAGLRLFRYRNVETPAQVRALTGEAQRAAGPQSLAEPGPLLIAADQEGGQLMGLGDGTTPFPGNMALGAVGDEELTRRVGRAMAVEMRAMGVNMVYAPDCDVATNTANPAIGIRSFADDPGAVARHASAMVLGLHEGGVAATAKHFPGMGDVALDSHLGLPVLRHGRERLDATELVPFRAAIGAGVDMVMSAHIALPSVTGDPGLPATLSGAVMGDLLRGDLGFEGLSITDALDMRALPQGEAQARAVVQAIEAGVDLLLCVPDEEARHRIEDALRRAAASGLLARGRVALSLGRLRRLRTWLSGIEQPDLRVVRSAEHVALAREVARRSITLVRNDLGLLPLRLASDAHVLAIMPAPRDLTPADTSSGVAPTLTAAIWRRHRNVDGIVVGHPPTEGEISAVRDQALGADLVVLGTIAASMDPGQAALANALLGTGVPIVTIALRAPYDLASYPSSATHLCSYGILPPTMDALGDALFGQLSLVGRLPVAIPGLYERGHGLSEHGTGPAHAVAGAVA